MKDISAEAQYHAACDALDRSESQYQQALERQAHARNPISRFVLTQVSHYRRSVTAENFQLAEIAAEELIISYPAEIAEAS